MLQTINIIGNMKNGTKKFLAVANIELDTLVSQEEIQEEYKKVLPFCMKEMKKKKRGNMAEVLNLATQKVMESYPGTILLSVNDDRAKGKQDTAFNFELNEQ